MRRGGASLALVIALVATGCGSPPTPPPSEPMTSAKPSTSDPVPPASDARPDLPITVPAAPAPAEPSAADPEALATAVEGGGQAALGPLLAAYAAAGIPVLDAISDAAAGDEAVGGPRWWQVWLSAAANPNASLSVADLTLLLSSPPDLQPLDAEALADGVLDDLRSMAESEAPTIAFSARYLAARMSARSNGVDPLGPDVTPDQVRLDPAAQTFLVAAIVQSFLLRIAEADPEGALAAIGPTDPWPLVATATGPQHIDMLPSAPAPASNPCSPSGTAGDALWWIREIASRITNGAEFSALRRSFPSVAGILAGRLGASESAAGRISTGISFVGAALNTLTFILQVQSLTVETDLQPLLERTKSASSDGRQARISVSVGYDLGNPRLDGGAGMANCLAILLAGLGMNVSVPTTGPLGGVTVTLDGRKGFATRESEPYVQFPKPSELRQDTKEDGPDTGKVFATVEGVHQREQVPDYAGEWSREFTVAVQATAEPQTSKNIFSVFVDSLVGVSGRGAGVPNLINAAVGIARTISMDLGEQGFLVTDWTIGWRIKESEGGQTLNGVHCADIGETWVLKDTRTGGMTERGTWAFAINPDTVIDGNTYSGGYRYLGTIDMPPLTMTTEARGDAVLVLLPDGRAEITALASEVTMTSKVESGPTTEITTDFPEETFVWEPVRDDCS